jgi:hypothetical protein
MVWMRLWLVACLGVGLVASHGPASTSPPPGLPSWRRRAPRRRGVGNPGVRCAGEGADRYGPLPPPLGDCAVGTVAQESVVAQPHAGACGEGNAREGKRC